MGSKGAYNWRYSRKSSNWHAFGSKLHVSRPPVERAGEVLGETPTGRSWKVRFDGEARIYLVSKSHAGRFPHPEHPDDATRATFRIPAWLWAKMMEQGER